MSEERSEREKRSQRRTLTSAVIEANRKNALRSTGPKTKEGKERVKYNAVKHGVLSDAIALFKDYEEESVYQRILEALAEHLKPQGPVENMLVERMAVAHWRYRRLLKYEVSSTRLNLMRLDGPLSGWGRVEELVARLGPSETQLWKRLMVEASSTIPKPDQMERILKYEASLERSFYRALDGLERLQRMRKGQRIDEPKVLHVHQD
jgi:hypothetical protein